MKLLFAAKKVGALASLLSVLALGGCGGQSSDSANSVQNASTVASTDVDVSRSLSDQYEPIVAQATGGNRSITNVKIESTTAATATNVPVTFGQVFVQGDVQKTDPVPLTGMLSDGTRIPLQVDAKATHPDGSLRHAVISAVLPKLVQNQTQTIDLIKVVAASRNAAPATPADLLNAGFSASANIYIDGRTYSASAHDLLRAGKYTNWLAGSIVNEWLISVPLKTVAGVEHPHLTARFAVRSYTGLGKARVDVIIENNKTFAAGAQNFTYNTDVLVGGQVVYSQAALTHYHHARWRKTFWWGTAPQTHIQHNTAYLMASKAVSNYDPLIVPAESALADLVTQLTPGKVGPMKIGLAMEYMPTAGGRPDIGPLPTWSVLYLLSMDKRAKKAMLVTADGAGSWPIHYRDETTDFPVRLDNAINKNISTHMNMAHLGPLPVPRCANNNYTLCATPMAPDTAHQPSLVYLPYLVTGDHYYLEELQFWAASNPLGTAAGNHGFEKGLVRWDQVRAQAWSLRTLGHAAYITPDMHPMKAYFNAQVDFNLDFYNTTYTIANPNQLGVFDGSGSGSVAVGKGAAPWQDDFFTWSVGYLAELGFTDAQRLLAWKAKFPVGRMTAPGYCWIEGAAYSLVVRPDVGQPVFATFAQAYAATIRNDAMTDDNGTPITHPAGLLYLDQPCGSQAQADWRTAAIGWTWPKGMMTGYSSSPMGYPSNMQPALAVAENSGIPNAKTAWTTFINRAAKPNYNAAPQWAIVPR
ncbi:MAG: hypothetical protein V4858_09495 [Pseudomonadota bacterium]